MNTPQDPPELRGLPLLRRALIYLWKRLLHLEKRISALEKSRPKGKRNG